MISTTFDSYDLIKDFKKAGFDEQRAAVQVHAAKLVLDTTIVHMRDEINAHDFAKEHDVKDLRLELQQVKAEIQEVKAELKVDIAMVRVEIEKSKNSSLVWMFGMLMGQTALIFGFFSQALDLF
jgi:hypothetical protein